MDIYFRHPLWHMILPQETSGTPRVGDNVVLRACPKNDGVTTRQEMRSHEFKVDKVTWDFTGPKILIDLTHLGEK